MQGKKQRKRYRRLDRAERAAIQSGLDKGRSCRQMARDLGRSPSTVADEVARNRTVAKGPGKGERVRGVPDCLWQAKSQHNGLLRLSTLADTPLAIFPPSRASGRHPCGGSPR